MIRINLCNLWMVNCSRQKLTLKSQFAILALAILVLGLGQADEIKIDSPQPKITTVAAMRLRKAPQVSAEEIKRLKLATVVNAIARSSNQDTISGKTDYWYRVNLPNGQTGWLFGGLLLDYNPSQRPALLRQIIEARLKAENTEFADWQETYNLAVSSISEAKDVNTRAEFEMFRLLALANWAFTVPAHLNHQSPYREWLKTYNSEVLLNEFAGDYNLRSEVLWNLEAKYHKLSIADRIAWEAAQNLQPSDCEGDEVCGFFRGAGEIKYLELHPTGSHATEAIKNLTDSLTDEVIKAANKKGGNTYEAQDRIALRKMLTSLRLAAAKTNAAEKTQLIKKLEKIN